MDVFVLNSSTYEVDSYVEVYSSLIWTDRFLTMSEFELRTPDVERYLTKLVEGTLLKITSSDCVMIVESREVVETSGKVELLIKGRSILSMLEQRSVHNGIPYEYDSSIRWDDQPVASPGDLQSSRLMKYFISPEATLVADRLPKINWSAIFAGYIDPFITQDNQVYDYREDTGSVYDNALSVASRYGAGLRARQTNIFDNFIDFSIYSGVDRTINQTTNSPVVFDESAGHFSSSNQIFSNKLFKNIAYVKSPLGFLYVPGPGSSIFVSGLNRRVLQVNASDLTDAAGQSAYTAITNRGLAELAKNQKTFALDFEVSKNNPFKFATRYSGDYGLGDKVTVKGLYGPPQTMVVSEYIITDGPDGENSYPTLTYV